MAETTLDTTPRAPQDAGTKQQDGQRCGQDTPERRTVAPEGSLHGIVADTERLA